MRRMLVVLLLLVLPFQFSWAAAAAYCQHEQSERTAPHVGHHEHQHTADSATPEPEQPGGALAIDMDCAYCHLGCANGIAVASHALPVLVLPTVPLARPGAAFESHVPALPERPDRHVA